MEFLFIVFYAAVLALVAPAVNIKSDRYGSFVPTAIALATGSVLWILLTCLDLDHSYGGYASSHVFRTEVSGVKKRKERSADPFRQLDRLNPFSASEPQSSR